MHIPQNFQSAALVGQDLMLVIVLGLVFFFFGGKKIPEMAKGLGEGIKNFKQAMKEEEAPKPPAETPTKQA